MFALEIASTHQLLRQHQKADRYYDLSISLAPNQATAYASKANNLIAWKGSPERARATLKVMPNSDTPDYFFAWAMLERLERDYTMVGEHEAAIEKLEHLLSIPSEITVWTLRLDPEWGPLRDHPRFGKLVGEDWQAEVSP